MSQPHVLLVEDERSLALLYTEYLKQEDIQVSHVASGREAINFAQSNPDINAILLDIRLPDMLGTEVLKEISELEISPAVIMITAHGSINTAVETMRSGAYDFLVKPFNRERLVQTLKSALDRQQLTVKVKKREIKFHHKGFQGFVGASKPMQVVYRMIEAASDSKATVFITGESGTGKEVCAEAIHTLSGRSRKPFVVINCAAIPKDLMESEIFGHIKGAFTGAVSDHEGAASRADGGTLFLDEICEMDMHLQSKLLRFVQTGTFNKVGSGKLEKVNIRFICATNRDPLMEIGAGRFREDLYYRLHVIPIPLPALRDRTEDILPIAQHFLAGAVRDEGKDFIDIGESAIAALRGYAWPGNVRQLQNIIMNAVVLNNGQYLEHEMLPPPLNQDKFTDSSLASMGYHRGGHEVPAAPIQRYGVSHGHAPLPPRPVYLSDEQQAAQKHVAPPVPQPFTEPVAHPEPSFAAPAPAKPGRDGIKPLWETEKDAIMEAIDSCNGNIPKAAALLGISASTIYRKKQSWEATEAKSEAIDSLETA